MLVEFSSDVLQHVLASMDHVVLDVLEHLALVLVLHQPEQPLFANAPLTTRVA